MGGVVSATTLAVNEASTVQSLAGNVAIVQGLVEPVHPQDPPQDVKVDPSSAVAVIEVSEPSVTEYCPDVGLVLPDPVPDVEMVIVQLGGVWAAKVAVTVLA